MSLDSIGGALRGPEGVKSRIAEIRARMGVDTGPKAMAGKKEFETALAAKGSAPAPLAGEITFNENKPMNPFAGVMQPSVGETQLRAMADSVARREGVDPKLLSALIETESGWDPMARSGKGAQGLAQLMPDTARELGVASPLDPEQSLTGGARYLKKMLDRFGGDRTLAVAAYNAGPGAVEKAGGVPNYAETQQYVKRVMARYGG